MPTSTPLLDTLESLTDELDLVIARGRASVPSHRHFEELADDVRSIARRMDEAARGKSQPASNPPMWVSADGRRAAW